MYICGRNTTTLIQTWEDGYQDGYKEGFRDGIQKGKEMGIIKTAKNMLFNKFDNDQIVLATGLESLKITELAIEIL